MSFPAAHRAKLHSVNPRERLNGEIKRRSDLVGIIPNEAAITSLAGVLLLDERVADFAGEAEPDASYETERRPLYVELNPIAHSKRTRASME